MLVEYQKLNEWRLFEVAQKFGNQMPVLEQIVEPPESASTLMVPTLERKCVRSTSPMLKARFEYAGSWREADAGHEWLSLQGMEEAVQDPKVLEQIKTRVDHWVDSPLLKLPASRVSLFGLYREQCEEIYLIWPLGDGGEPEILSYVGNFEERFSNFADYLKHLLEDN